MAIKRYVANADNSITNAFKSDLSTRGTGSNMGAADSLEVFSLRGQTSSSSGQSSELSRMLIKFPVNTISADRTAATIPASGSVKFYLKMYNAEHPFTLARNFQLNVYPVSASTWQEGFGLDMEEYKDITYDGSGSNWDRASSEAAWVTGSGGDYVTSFFLTASFTNGWEDMDIEITPLVERWMQTSGTALHFANSGALIKLTDVQESASFSYYTKKFFARSTEFFFKRPVIEARWDSRTKDQRGSIYYSSSLAPAADNLNTIYLYNYIRGKLTNIPNSSSVATTGSIYVSLYSGSSSPTGSKLLLPAGGGVVATNDVNITGGYVSTGIYSASFAVTGATSLASSSAPLTRIFDVWHNGTGILSLGGKTEYYTGSISPKSLSAYNNAPTFEHVTAITNLKSQYFRNEVARFRLFVREKNWNPNIYTVTTTTPVNETIVSASYKIIRLADELAVVPYGTGSSYETYLSHDVSGNYFDLSMKLLESDYAYGVKLSYYNPSIATWVEQPEIFKFRVEQ